MSVWIDEWELDVKMDRRVDRRMDRWLTEDRRGQHTLPFFLKLTSLLSSIVGQTDGF